MPDQKINIQESGIDARRKRIEDRKKKGESKVDYNSLETPNIPNQVYKDMAQHNVNIDASSSIPELYAARDAAIKAERIETGKQVAQFFAVVLLLALIGFGIWKLIQNPIKISEFKPKETTPNVADELLKLHELLEKKAITQEEFDTQKKKLLSK